VIAFRLITFLHVVVGELAPKSIALQDPERTALFVAGPTLLTEKIFKPAIWVLNGAGSSLLRLVGVRATSGHGLVHSVEELKMLVDASTQGGVMEVEESNMLHGVFDMRELIVRQVMIPRTEIEAIELHTPLDEVIAHAIESSYTKFPVYKENLDEIVGIIHIKDVLLAMREPERQDRTAADIKREALFVPDTIEVNALLSLFRDKRQHIAIALDEFGGTAGIVTLEDLLEEIVGEVSGPFDPGAPDIQEQPDGSILIDGLTLIEEVNEKLKLTIVEDYYDTIAGYILGKLNHVPKEGEYYDEGSLRLLVEEMDKMRIARVRLYTNRPASPGATTSAEDPPPADAPSGDAKAGR
jgi:CBS domain containing-hemolysin-like protein